MDNYALNWYHFFLYTSLVIGLYFLLMLLSTLLANANFLGVWQTRLNHLLQFALRAYEPIALVVVLITFIFVEPIIHGLIVGFFILLGFQPIRNYINGRIFLLGNEMKEGQRIQIATNTGVIQKKERLGILLQTPEGLRFVNYSSLLSDGFVLLKGKKIGGLHELQVTAKNDEKNHLQILNGRLFSCPYIDWTYKPEISSIDKENNKFGIRILVREDQHLGHLMRLIQEWGYAVELAQ